MGIWGKWRPSTQARRNGAIGILLERLTICQKLSFEQACTVLETVHHVDVGRAALEDIYERLPSRTRRHFVCEDALANVRCPGPGADRIVTAAARARVAVRTSRALAAALAALSPKDRLILKLRFSDGLTVGEIARRVSSTRLADPKPLYRHVQRLLGELRARLEERGVAGADVLDTLGVSEVAVPQVLEQSTSMVETEPASC